MDCPEEMMAAAKHICSKCSAEMAPGGEDSLWE